MAVAAAPPNKHTQTKPNQGQAKPIPTGKCEGTQAPAAEAAPCRRRRGHGYRIDTNRRGASARGTGGSLAGASPFSYRGFSLLLQGLLPSLTGVSPFSYRGFSLLLQGFLSRIDTDRQPGRQSRREPDALTTSSCARCFDDTNANANTNTNTINYKDNNNR